MIKGILEKFVNFRFFWLVCRVEYTCSPSLRRKPASETASFS